MAKPNPSEPSIEIETEALGTDARSLLLPYTVITRNSNYPFDTENTLDNTSGLDVTVLIRMFDQDRNLISDLTVIQDVLLAETQAKYSQLSLVPPAIQDFSCGVVIEASQPAPLSRYTIDNRNDPSAGFTPVSSMLRIAN